MKPTKTRTEVEHDIRETMGLVPTFFDQIQDEFLHEEWSLFK